MCSAFLKSISNIKRLFDSVLSPIKKRPLSNIIVGLEGKFCKYRIWDKGERISMEKEDLRKRIKSQKKQLSSDEKILAADVVFDKIEQMIEFQSAINILVYWSTLDELPTQAFIKKWYNQKNLFLPCVDNDKLVLKRFLSENGLIKKSMGIWEPSGDELYMGKIEFAIVPGVGFDKNRNRMGRGKGYYDRFLDGSMFSAGVGFDCQLFAHIPANRLDKKVNVVVTPSNLIR